jgi:hypothetical protein
VVALSDEAGTELLVPAAEEKLTSWLVSTRVNKAGGADDATCIDKVRWRGMSKEPDSLPKN